MEWVQKALLDISKYHLHNQQLLVATNKASLIVNEQITLCVGSWSTVRMFNHKRTLRGWSFPCSGRVVSMWIKFAASQFDAIVLCLVCSISNNETCRHLCVSDLSLKLNLSLRRFKMICGLHKYIMDYILMPTWDTNVKFNEGILSFRSSFSNATQYMCNIREQQLRQNSHKTARYQQSLQVVAVSSAL